MHLRLLTYHATVILKRRAYDLTFGNQPNGAEVVRMLAAGNRRQSCKGERREFAWSGYFVGN